MNRIVIITGAAGSLGLKLCEIFIEDGDFVIGLDNSAKRLSCEFLELANSNKNIVGIECDITDEKKVAVVISEIILKYKKIDVLINNAGGNTTTTISNTSVDQWKHDVDLNLNGHFYMINSVLPIMKTQFKGCILNIGSVNAMQVFGDPAYSAAKAGLLHLTKFLATEYGKYNIRTNIISPGSLITQAWDEMSKQDERLFEKFSELCSLNSLATCEDVANSAYFLCSEKAKSINGSNLVVDAGLTAGISVVANTFINTTM